MVKFHTRQVNPEVLYSDQSISCVSVSDIQTLKEKAEQNPRKRIRVCAHHGVEDTLHEMLIVHARNTYIQPHKHLGKPESFHLIEGTVDVVIFEEDGGLREVIQMGEYASGRSFYYRMSDPLYHTLLIRSDILVFHETTTGPFNRAQTVFAPWAPQEDDDMGKKTFLARLESAVREFISDSEGSV